MTPAVTVSAAGDTLTVLGDNLPDRVRILDDGLAATVQADQNGDGDFADQGESFGPFDGISLYDINLQGGRDVLEFALAGSLTSGQSRTVNARLGIGADQCFFDTAGNALSGADLAFTVRGGVGDDLVRLNLDGALSASARLSVTALLGDGADIYSATYDLGTFEVADENSAARFSVDGGAGADILRSAAEFAGPAAPDAVAYVGGLLELIHRGNTGRDNIGVDFRPVEFDGGAPRLEVDGNLRVRADGEVGNDEVFVELALASPNSGGPAVQQTGADGTSGGNLDAVVAGGDGDDRLTFLLRGAAASYDPLGFILIDGGAGIDRCESGTEFGSGAVVVERGCEDNPGGGVS